MTNIVSSAFVLLSFSLILGSAFSDASSSSDEEFENFRSSSTFLQYKVKALNTALYYILQALEDDLKDGEGVDIDYFKRVNTLVNKIKFFSGEVDQTNSLMLGQILRTLPDDLRTMVDQDGINFDEYTAATLAEAFATPPTTLQD